MDKEFRWIIGLDAHSRICEACVIHPNGDQVDAIKFLTSGKNLIKVAERYPQAVFVLEESGMTQWFVEMLTPHAADVFVSDPKQNKWITSGTKSDRIDAEKLAKMYLIGSLHRVYHTLDSSRVEFKRTVQYRESLVRDMTRLKNEIKATYQRYGLVIDGKTAYRPGPRDEWMKRLPALAQARLLQFYQRLDMGREQERDVTRMMIEQGAHFPEIQLFTKLPGVGDVTACVFSAYVQTPNRFSDKHHLWSYAGLKVITKSSAGKFVGRPYLTRSGVMPLKAVSRCAFLGALNCAHGQNEIAEYYRRHFDSSKNPRAARLATQRKILSILLHLWKTGEEYDSKKVV